MNTDVIISWAIGAFIIYFAAKAFKGTAQSLFNILLVVGIIMIAKGFIDIGPIKEAIMPLITTLIDYFVTFITQIIDKLKDFFQSIG